MEKKLFRSNNKMLAGVCAGIAEFFNLDPTLVRIAYVIVSIFSAGFPGILLYMPGSLMPWLSPGGRALSTRMRLRMPLITSGLHVCSV